MRILPALFVLAGLSSAAFGQQFKYVTDSLRLEARVGPSTGHRIVQMLPTGTRLEVIEESNGWSRVNLPQAGRGSAWILSRYLRSDPPPRQALADALAEATVLREKYASFDQTMKDERATVERLRSERDELASAYESTHAELTELKATAASAISIRDENKELTHRYEELQSAHTRSVQDHRALRASRERDWFVAGGGVLLLGMILGLIIPRIRWRRKRGWSEL